MCGIYGEVGNSGSCLKRTITGVKSLEHRGYDSMGVVFSALGKTNSAKIISPFGDKNADDLWPEITKIVDADVPCKIALGHTRWATCGAITQANAHPHKGQKSYIVHNGNVINIDALKKRLLDKDCQSETDTEIIVKLIDQYYSETNDYLATISKVLSLIDGSQAFVLFNEDFPSQLFCASKGGPLLIGKTNDSMVVASDPTAFASRGLKQSDLVPVEHIAIIGPDSWEEISRTKEDVEVDLFLDNGLNGFAHYMLKEIHEQPQAILNAIRGRIDLVSGNAHLGGLHGVTRDLSRGDIARDLRQVETFHFIGCGTAFNACRYGVALFNRFGIDARGWIASEFVHNHPFINPNDAFIFVSQSGETADTIEAIKEIKIKGNICLGVVNVPDSRIARLTDAGVYIQAGLERGVASTKAFTGMMSVILLLAVYLARQRKMTLDTGAGILEQMRKIPEMVSHMLEQTEQIEAAAERILAFDNLYYMGRYFNYIIAEEGSLKLKEISYKHAEAYPLGEMKHGPLALISPDFYSVIIAPLDALYKESIVNIREVLCRNGEVLAITSEDAEYDLPTACIRIPALPKKFEFMYPFLTIIPLQLISYYVATRLGFNPDKPRNLAKSVTVN